MYLSIKTVASAIFGVLPVFMAIGAHAAINPVIEGTADGLYLPAFQNYSAWQNLDGSYYWQDNADPSTANDIFNSVPETFGFTLTGGTGATTVYVPVTITLLQSESDVYGPTGTLLTNQAHGNASLNFDTGLTNTTFHLDGTQSLATPINFVLSYAVTYNQVFGIFLGVEASVSTDPADNDVALCGVPGPSNTHCSLESTMSLTTSFDAPYIEIPYGTTLIQTGDKNQIAVMMVPEPSDNALMFAGLGVIGLFARTRRSKA